MTYKHTAGYQRGESPSNAGRPNTHTHTHIHTHKKIMKKIMKNNEKPQHTSQGASITNVRSTSITNQILIVIAQRKKKLFANPFKCCNR